MLTKKQFFALFIIVVLFSAVGCANWKYRKEISDFINEKREKLVIGNAENEKNEGEKNKNDQEKQNYQELTEKQKLMMELDNSVNPEIFPNPSEVIINKNENGSYGVKNQFDDYSFILPNSWNNVEKKDISSTYFQNQAIKAYVSSVLRLRSGDHIFQLIKSELEIDLETNLEDYLDEMFNSFETNYMVLVDNTRRDEENQIIVMRKVKEGEEDKIFTYFRKDNVVYTIVGVDSDIAIKIIKSGKWNSQPKFSVKEANERRQLMQKIDNL
jgi:hypothetical protein